MLRKLFITVVFLFFAIPAFATTRTTASCGQSDVHDKIALMVAGDITIISTTGSPCHWSTQLNETLPPNATIIGQGANLSNSVIGNSGGPVIVDDYSSGSSDCQSGATSSPLMVFSMNSGDTLANPSRIAGFTVQGGTGNAAKFGTLQFNGASHFSRIDHITNDQRTYSIGCAAASININGDDMWALVDHGIVYTAFGDHNGITVAGSGEGDAAWNAASNHGQNNFVFVEKYKFYANNFGSHSHGAANDTSHGGRMVVRFSDLCGDATVGCVGVQTHPTGGGGARSRGGRALESYANIGTGTPLFTQFNGTFISSGTGYYWGNNFPQGFQSFATIHSDLRYGTVVGYPYDEAVPPSGWGYCGPNYQTGTVNTSGFTVTGSGFNVSWPASTMIVINGIGYAIASVDSTTQITLMESAGTQSGVTYVLGSYANENADTLTGRRCIDQPGNGIGDLLFGDRPNTVNSNRTTGGHNCTALESCFWPRQAVEPIYEFLNTWACSGCDNASFFVNYNPDVIVQNVNVFNYNTGVCVAGGSCPSGVGSGTTLPTTCGLNAGFFKTNEGTWNSNADVNYYTGQGRFYQCGASNNWTLVYTPYTYPHPLDTDITCTPDHLTFTAQPNGTVVGATLGTVTVGIYDSGNLPCGSATNTITIANKGGTCTGMTLEGTTSAAASGGVFTTSNLTENASGSCTLSATSAGLTGVDSNSFTISAAVSTGGGIRLRRISDTHVEKPKVVPFHPHRGFRGDLCTEGRTSVFDSAA